jgi:hypothetical protein
VGVGLGASPKTSLCFLGRWCGATWLHGVRTLVRIVVEIKTKNLLGTSRFNGALYCALLLYTSLLARCSCRRSSPLSRRGDSFDLDLLGLSVDLRFSSISATGAPFPRSASEGGLSRLFFSPVDDVLLRFLPADPPNEKGKHIATQEQVLDRYAPEKWIQYVSLKAGDGCDCSHVLCARSSAKRDGDRLGCGTG